MPRSSVRLYEMINKICEMTKSKCETTKLTLTVPQELGRAVGPGGEGVAGDAQQLVQVGEGRAGGIGEGVVGRVDVELVGPDLLHVQALLGQRDGGRAGEDLGGVLAQIVHDALDLRGGTDAFYSG